LESKLKLEDVPVETAKLLEDAKRIRERHDVEVKAFYEKLQKFISDNPEVHAYGVEFSMSYQTTNDLIEIGELLVQPYNGDWVYWLPSSWERC